MAIKFNKTVDLDYSLVISVILLLLAIASRLIPHEPNFTPIIAIAIFLGSLKKNPFFSACGIFLVMAASNLMLGATELYLMPIFTLMAICFLAQFYLSKNSKRFAYLVPAIGGPIVFFLVTNFAVWAKGSMYPMTLAGLTECYTLAIPFFRNTLTSSIFYSIALIESYQFITMCVDAKPRVENA